MAGFILYYYYVRVYIYLALRVFQESIDIEQATIERCCRCNGGIGHVCAARWRARPLWWAATYAEDTGTLAAEMCRLLHMLAHCQNWDRLQRT